MRLSLRARGQRIRQARKLGAKTEVFADAAAVEDGVEGGARRRRSSRPAAAPPRSPGDEVETRLRV